MGPEVVRIFFAPDIPQQRVKGVGGEKMLVNWVCVRYTWLAGNGPWWFGSQAPTHHRSLFVVKGTAPSSGFLVQMV